MSRWLFLVHLSGTIFFIFCSFFLSGIRFFFTVFFLKFGNFFFGKNFCKKNNNNNCQSSKKKNTRSIISRNLSLCGKAMIEENVLYSIFQLHSFVYNERLCLQRIWSKLLCLNYEFAVNFSVRISLQIYINNNKSLENQTKLII